LEFKNLGRVEKVSYDALPDLRGPCTPQTREQILDKLMAWATDDTACPVYWLGGMAGTGKTTIAYSFCERLEQVGLLSASFFCTRTEEATRDPKGFIPTIAYQTASRLPDLVAPLISELQKPGNDEIRYKALDVQFETLIRRPAMSLSSQEGFKSHVVVFDGFDEAKRANKGNTKDEIRQIISLFLKHSADVPFKVFISSRLDDEIKAGFHGKGTDSQMHEALFLHDIEDDIVEADIMCYITDYVDAITTRLPWRDRGSWISDDQIRSLTLQAGNLFVYASALCSFLDGGAEEEVQERLMSVLQVHQDVPEIQGTPHQKLDELYQRILETAEQDLQSDSDIKSVLHVLLAARNPLDATSISMILGYKLFRIEKVVRNLRSVLTAPDKLSDHKPITIFHASFLEYLTDFDRSGKFFVCVNHGHETLALGSFQIMLKELQFNIWRFPSSFLQNKDASLSKDHILNALAYACQSWSYHLDNSGDTDLKLGAVVKTFLEKKLLFWLEVLSGLGIINSARKSLLSLQRQLTSTIENQVL
jgi:hypothetical protein